MSSSLRKSDYVEKVLVNGNKLAYRILNEEEVVEKKKKKAELKKMKKEESDYGSDLSSVDSPKSSGVGSPGSSGVGSPGSSGVDSPGSSGIGSPDNSGIDSTVDDLDIESSSKLIQVISPDHALGFACPTMSVLKGNLLSDKFIPMPASDPMDFVEEPMHVDNTVDVNLSKPQNPIIGNGSVMLGTVDYTCTGDNIPTQEILSEQDLQNFKEISYENFITENSLSNDGSLPSIDDIPCLDFNLEEFLGSSQVKLELPPLMSGESTSGEVLAQVDEDIFTPDDPPNETLPVMQENEIQQPTRETLCSTPLITETPTPQMRKSTKHKPNASVKTAEALTEAANARKIAVERETQHTEKCREEEFYRKREHRLKMKVLRAELKANELLIKRLNWI
ncbi:hypothetical protein TNCT_122591 [Trichonephila clavata]|uniref:Uncharacterized protein n=1 Tax=Trichonephila clavata TaxID=2740835 RepID=A0A8X6LTY7_TRICU|nr:hypothetical protein TNCT_122591 [Trichonephila clavata]